jgi:hypothetical protein
MTHRRPFSAPGCLCLSIAFVLTGCSRSPELVTWNGLRFGSSFDEVRDRLAKQKHQLEKGKEENSWKVTPDWDLLASGVPFPIHFEPILYFRDSSKLSSITLSLNQAHHLQDYAKSPPPLSDYNLLLLEIGRRHIHDDLISKYGSPFSQLGDCPLGLRRAPSNATYECRYVFKGQQQYITEDWVCRKSASGEYRTEFRVTYSAARESGL